MANLPTPIPQLEPETISYGFWKCFLGELQAPLRVDKASSIQYMVLGLVSAVLEWMDPKWGGDYIAAKKANGKVLKYIVLIDGIHRYHFSYDAQRYDLSPPKFHMLTSLKTVVDGMRRRKLDANGSPCVYAEDQETEELVGEALKHMLRILASYSRDVGMRDLAIALCQEEDPEGMARNHSHRRGLCFLPRKMLD